MSDTSSSALIERAALASRFVLEGSDLLKFGALIALHRSPNGSFTTPHKRPYNRYLGAAQTQFDLEVLVHVFRPDALALACDASAGFVAARASADANPFERQSLFESERENTVAIRDEGTGLVTYLFRREPYGTRPARPDDRFQQVDDFVIIPPSPGFAFIGEATMLAHSPIKLKH